VVDEVRKEKDNSAQTIQSEESMMTRTDIRYRFEHLRSILYQQTVTRPMSVRIWKVQGKRSEQFLVLVMSVSLLPRNSETTQRTEFREIVFIYIFD
jgi:hypothetical protein